MNWIFGHFRRDFLFLLAPGLVGMLIPVFLPHVLNPSLWIPFYSLLALGFVDSGHVHMTMWRTWFNPEERKSNPLYWQAPLAIFIGVFLWLRLGLPYLWRFTVYITIFHQIRQYYGISRWYQRLNHRFSAASGYFLYLLTIIPVTGLHFRAGIYDHYYTTQDMTFYPNELYFKIAMILDLAVFAAWVGYEFAGYLRGQREWNRILSVGFPAVMYAIVFFHGKTTMEVVVPLVLTHGIGYLGMTSLSLHRSRKNLFPVFAKAALILIATALVLGGLDAYLEDEWLEISQDYLTTTISFFQAGLISIYLTPLFSHYLFDAWIWKGDHREAHLVYSAEAS